MGPVFLIALYSLTFRPPSRTPYWRRQLQVPCPDGFQCLCRPCVYANEIQVFKPMCGPAPSALPPHPPTPTHPTPPPPPLVHMFISVPPHSSPHPPPPPRR